MSISDISYILQWWFVLFIVGGIFFPLTTLVFRNFASHGYFFSKILGMILVTYSIFALGIFHLLPFNFYSLLLVLFIWAVVNCLLFKKNHIPLSDISVSLITQELFFLALLTFWSFVRAHEPGIHGLEKYMDMGFVNSILRSTYFPPKDMWYANLPINYYYFGHVVTAVLTKLSGLPSRITFNLMIASLFALSVTACFVVATELLPSPIRVITKKRVAFGLLSAALAMVAGNLHVLYAFFAPYGNNDPLPFWKLVFLPSTFPNSYWYPNATRFIPFTIHEFPIYSFVVSDLHGHVLDIPFILLLIGVLLYVFLAKKIRTLDLILISLLLSVAYMTNAWDAAIYLLLTGVVLLVLYGQKHLTMLPEKSSGILYRIQSKPMQTFIFELVKSIGIIITGFIIFSIPFSLHFKPFVSGIGIVCPPQFLIRIHSLGPFVFEANRCDRSTWWQLATLYGFFYFFVGIFYVYLFRKKSIQQRELFVFILTIVSTLLLISPEFVYMRDIYPQYYRANTMFKLAYQAFILLSISSGYVVYIIVKKMKNLLLIVCSFALLVLVFSYPYFAVDSYYNSLSDYQGLDGLTFLNKSYPDDFMAINWINTHISGQPVILEAQGDSYTDYERVSSFTGLPTVMGWTVHEWLWRGTYDTVSPRVKEVQTLYEGSISQTIPLLKRYDVQYVYIGGLEHQKYPLLNMEKFSQLGTVIYKNQTVTIFKINSSLPKE